MDLARRLNPPGPNNKIVKIIGILAVANFVIFAVVAMAIGGNASSGKLESGHYFVANHGRFTEVSEAVFTYSLWHMRSLFVTHPLAMICWWFGYYAGGGGLGRR